MLHTPVTTPSITRAKAIRDRLWNPANAFRPTALTAPPPKPMTFESVISAVAVHFSMNEADLFVRKRLVSLVVPRQTAMYLVKTLLSYSYPKTAYLFGGFHHTSVLYAVKRIERMRGDDREFNIEIEDLMRKCLSTC